LVGGQLTGGGGQQGIPPIGAGEISGLTDEFRRQREEDIAKGRARGEEFFGSVEDIQKQRAERSVDIADVIRKRRSIAESGFGSDFFQAARESRLRNLGRQEQGAQRQLASAQGAGGVGGPLASAQGLQLQRDINRNRLAAEQNLLLEDARIRQQGLGDFEKSVKAEQTNLANLLKGILGFGFAEADLGAGERATAGQILTGQRQAQADEQRRQGNILSDLFGGLFS
jgi:hypothetical protein